MPAQRSLYATSRPARLGAGLVHCLYPLVALVLILGSLLWGPWGTLALAVLWWRLAVRLA